MRRVCKRCFRTTNDREWNRIISFRYFATTLPEPFDIVGVKREIGFDTPSKHFIRTDEWNH